MDFLTGLVLPLPQGTIFLPGNRVSEHSSSGEDGGKFLFEVIPGKEFFLASGKRVKNIEADKQCHLVNNTLKLDRSADLIGAVELLNVLGTVGK